MNERFSRLARLAVLLNELTIDPNARVSYDLFAGGLTWSDEWADAEFEICTAIRVLWRYRSSLICGKPDERFREHWEFAKQSCPNWPGFQLVRQDPKWKDLYEKLDAEGVAGMEELDERFRRQQAARGADAVKAS